MKKIEKMKFKNGIKERRFFDRVSFDKKETEDILTDWIYWMEKTKNIRKERFMHLLWEIGEISFPIKIKEYSNQEPSYSFLIVDALENKFFLKVEKFSTRFMVIRNDEETEEKWMLCVTKMSTVKILEYYNKFEEDNGLEVNKVETAISYDEEEQQLKAVVCENEVYVIIFKLDIREIMNYKEIVNIIKDMEVKDYCTVFVPFVKLREKTNSNAIIAIQTFVEDDKFAEIEITDGYVTKETETRILFNGESIQTDRRRMNMLVEDYIRKNKYKFF